MFSEAFQSFFFVFQRPLQASYCVFKCKVHSWHCNQVLRSSCIFYHDDGDTLEISIPCAFLVEVVEGESMLCLLLINFIEDMYEGEALPGLGLSYWIDLMRSSQRR